MVFLCTGLPWRYKEYNFDDEDISSDEETGSGRRGGRKKWEMRYLKMAKSGRPPWSCDMSLFPPSTSFEVNNNNICIIQ